ncbi:putative ubiquitin hydrolase [Leptomonas seymouri]|uniref:ubiquitinyl hydrolase 1 n=1 Tax=Leptomonas seymouri TaxID=5684 RepID=A0A0N0P4C4_LEPSE|nr:putative ubiquitin hydrolase [Leptomonas seymouri]|eukprot:KPI85129.1 putative ubiquitin hydrolase [Leptomonas seymouri]
MPPIESAFSVTAADVRLPPADAWATEVLQRCSHVHYKPQRDLLRILAPLSPAAASTAGSAVVAQAPTVINVDVEEDIDVSPDSLSSCGGDSCQPYLPLVVRAVPTAEMQALRKAFSTSLLRTAYRAHTPCVAPHTTKVGRQLGCAASPRCMVGLRSLAGDAVTREDCMNVMMGDGPHVVAVPATNAGAAAAGNRKGARASSSAKHVGELKGAALLSCAPTLTATRTVTDDPAFPCLWRGVRNLANTCYFSSVLQMVFSVARLRCAILNDGASERGGPTAPATTAVKTQLEESGLKELFALMAFSREGAGADPQSFASYLSLDVKMQQDAQEFFTLLLDWLRCRCGPAVQAAVTNTFSGTLLYDRCCGVCGRSAKRAESFLYLSLPVRPTLEDSLSEFSKPEEVDGFMCEGCGKTAVATSRQYMRTLPDVLIVHWNRFEFDLQTLQRHKVTTATSYPLQLDMAAYVRQWHEHKRGSSAASGTAGGSAARTSAAERAARSDKDRRDDNFHYELRGVVNHHGDTAVSGHYTYHGKVSLPSSTAAADAAVTGPDMWLNFNDAVVTPLSRYQGQRGVSSDAYLLVYHRVNPAPPSNSSATASAPITTTSTTTGTAASAVASSTSASPTPAEFPLYLCKYVDRVNQRCLDERQAWLHQRAQVADFYDLWAATAHAVFDASTSVGAAAAAALPAWSSTAAAVYALPTAWLQEFGRCFLPAYVDVASLGGGAASQLKRNRQDTAGGSAGEGTGGPGDDVDGKSNLSGLHGAAGTLNALSEEEGAALLEGGPVDGVVVPAIGPRPHGGIQSLEEFYQLVRRHSLLQALPSLSCAHGYLAPWGAYKFVSAAAFAKLLHFLSVCGAPLNAARPADDNTSGAAVDAQTSCAFTDSNLCPLCVAAMAATVQGLAVSSAEDEQAELCLTQAWRDAEKEREAGEGGEHRTSPAPSHSSTHRGGEAEESGQTLVSETVAAGWASYYVSERAWGRVLETEGYTAVVVMKESRLSPPWAPSSDAGTFHSSHLSGDNSDSGATSPQSPTSPTTAATTISLTLASSGSGVGATALKLLKGDVDLSSQLLCPHGALRPGQRVLAIPEALRRFWMRRFAEVLTVAHRAGQLRTTDPSWRVTEGDMEHFLLPHIPASSTSTTCHECMRTSVQALTSRHHQRLRKMEERKKFPSLWLAGAMTSPSGIAQLLLATGAENEEQLLAAQHPNRLVFKNNAEREYREYVKRWTEAQQARIAQQELEVKRLQATVSKKKESDAVWNVRVASRRGGRNPGREGAGGGRGSASHLLNADGSSASAPPAPDPETLEGRLFYAMATLEELRAQPAPDFDVSYGCVPTWWVARWYAAMQDDVSPSSGVDSLDEADKDRGEEAWGDAATANRLPPLSYDKLVCKHGGCLLDVPWLNPSDGFWQGVRGKRAEVLWNGVRVERATMAAPEDQQNRVDATSSCSLPCAAGSGPGKAEHRSQCWLPPLVILPMEEYQNLLSQYAAADALAKPLGSDPNAGEEAPSGKPATSAGPAVTDANAEVAASAPSAKKQTCVETSNVDGAPLAQSLLSPPPGPVICVVVHNGVRQLQPASCAACCAQLLANFEVHCEAFVNGSLKLNFHIKKSRKNFYDASSVLTSAAVQQSKASTVPAALPFLPPAPGGQAGVPMIVRDSDIEGDSSRGGVEQTAAAAAAAAAAGGHMANDDATADGIHYYTTLAQLRLYISAHLREKHGYLVPPADLQITRGKNRPLKLRSPLPPAEAGSRAERGDDPTALEHASLQDLGIRDGDTLTVHSVDIIAQPCATAPGAEEEWETIPPELLQAGGASGAGSGGGQGAVAAKEHSVAFRETRLQGSHTVRRDHHSGAVATASAPAAGVAMATAATRAEVSGSAASAEQPVACAVCTFLNAPGMVVCEMCEAPLPTR